MGKNLNDPTIEVNKVVEDDNFYMMVKEDGSINKVKKEFSGYYPLPPLYGLDQFSQGEISHIICGVDSLTAGAYGDSYFDFFAENMRSQLGDGGIGYMSFDNDVASREGVSFGKTGFEYISQMDKSIYPAIYSFDFGGLHETNFVTGDFFDWNPNRAWDTMKVFYLVQPGGGEFKIDHTTKPAIDYRYTVDTDGSLSIGTVEITRESGQGSGISLRWVGDGTLTVFGCFGYRDSSKGGVMISRQAFGGFKMSEYAGLLDAVQALWFSLLTPDLYVLNGGMNDRGADDAPTYISNVSDFLGNLPSTCDILLVGCNSPQDESSTHLSGYRSELLSLAKNNQYGFVNNMLILGTYTDANSNGLMADTVHPNRKANKIIASYICGYLGFNGNTNSSPPDAYEGAGSAGGYVYTGELPVVRTSSVLEGSSEILYNIGIAHGSAYALFEFEVTAGRVGSSDSVRTRWIMQFTNGTGVLNKVSSVSAGDVSEIEEYRKSAGDGAHNHTLSASVVSDLARVEITSDAKDQIYTVKCKYSFSFLTVEGQSVFVN